MIYSKSIHIKQKTATLVLDGEDNYLNNLNYYEIAALLLLTGFYNPLRRVSPSDNPIDLESLKGYKQRFQDLINEVISEAEVNADEIGKIVG